MGSEKTVRMGLLERLLDMAMAQKKFLSENRLAELAGIMTEREEIISRLKGLGEPEDREKEAAIIKDILSHDSNLRVSMEVELEETCHELEKLSHCNMAHKAYISGRFKIPSERSSRDG